MFAYINQRQVFPERDPAGQANATCSSCLKKLAVGCMLVFLQSSSKRELQQTFKMFMESSSVFAEPSVNHSQVQDQHWSAPLTCLTNQHLDPFPYPKTAEKTGDYRSNFHEHMHVMGKPNPAVPCS